MKNIKNKLLILCLYLAGAFALCDCTALNNKTALKHAQSNQSGYVHVDGGKLFYKKFGSGSPVIVLHGGPGLDQEYLLPQMLELAKDYEVIFYDQRGSGQSLATKIDPTCINIHQFVKDLDTLRKHMGVKKFTLVGHSWGGFLAMNYAVKYPQHLSNLILLNTCPADFKGQQGFVNEFMKRTKPIANQISPLSDYNLFEKLKKEEISKLYRTLFSVYFYNPNEVEKLNLNMAEASSQSGFKVHEHMSKTDFLTDNINLFPKLKTLKVPTLIVHGNQDLMPAWTAQAIQKAVSNSEIVYLEQCGHFSYIEKPVELFSKMRNFMGKKNQGGSKDVRS